MRTITITRHELASASSEDELHELARQRGLDLERPFEQEHDAHTGDMIFYQRDELKL